MTGLGAVLATDGIWLLLAGVVLAGLVRGFTGFGTAMVYLPFAGQVLDPVAVLVTLLIIDLVGPLPAVPRALRDGHPRDVARLGAGALVGVPLGVSVLVTLNPETFRTAVSVLTLVLLVLLVGGFRYRGAVGKPLIYGIGGLGGFLGGAGGLTGPPVLTLYNAPPPPVEGSRASTPALLILADILMLGVFGLRGLITAGPLWTGLVLILPYLAAVTFGAYVFHPRHARAYRWAAYAIIAGSALGGLPIWD